jgi:hexosaminidase
MAQAEGWGEPGASWAGFTPPEKTYAYEAEGEFPGELRERMRGIQACIWGENFVSRKDWLRFAAIVRMWPTL